MAQSRFAKLHNIKCHPLPLYHSRNSGNKVNVTIHPRVTLRKRKEEMLRTRQRATTILTVGNGLGTSPEPESRTRFKWASQQLQVHFAYSNSVGGAPNRFDKSVKWQLKGPYFLVNSLGMLDNLLIVWECIQEVIRINTKTEIGLYIQVAKNISFVMLRIVHMGSLWNDADKYASIFATIDGTSYSSGLHDYKKTSFAIGISILGFIRALSKSLTGITSGAQFLLLRHCGRIITSFARNWSAPEENIDFPCGLLGVLGFMTSLSGGIIQQAAITGSVIAATTLLSACKEFKYKETPEGLLESGPGNANNNVPPSSHIGKRYAELKKISKAINSAFSPILKLMLLANLFMFSSLINNIFKGNIAKGAKTWLLFDAALACVFLYLANAIANTGEKFREWLKAGQNRIQVGMSQLDVLQEEGSSQSIGIGRGAFFISDGFLLGYAGAIVAYFFGIVETRPAFDAEFESGYGNRTVSPCACNCYCHGN